VGMSNPSETQTNQPSMPTYTTEGGAGQALFCGTYGQVREALKDAGLEVIPCEQFGFKDAKRVGTLFIADSNSQGGAIKLTLWG